MDKALRDDLRFEGLPAVLERFAGAFGGRAALALRPRVGEPPAIIAVHPPGAADLTLLTQISALMGDHQEVIIAGGCFRSALAPGYPGSGHGQWPDSEGSRPPPDALAGSALVAVAEPVAGRPSCALILLGDDAHWTAETQTTAAALASVIAAQYRRAADIVDIAEREEVTRALIEASPDAVVIADATRHIVAFNAAAEEMLGRRRAEVIGRDMRSVLIPERDHARFMAGTELFLQTGDRGEFTGTMRLPVLHADGRELMVELTPLPLTVGPRAFFCCFLRDVSELERANAALVASEARFRLLSGLAPVGIARTDRGGKCSFVNERWCVLGGGSADDFAGDSWMKVIHPDDAGKVALAWVRARAQGSELRTDCRLQPNGGPQLWVHAAVAALPEGDEQPAGFLVALTNVSARKRAEEESGRLLAAERAARRSLADETERLNSLIAAAIPGVLFVDENNVIMRLNQSLCDMVGLKEPIDQLIGGTGVQLLTWIGRAFADPAEVAKRMTRYRLARQRAGGLQIGCSDGRTLECDYSPVFADRQYRGDLWLLWDVSERAAHEEQSERRIVAELASRRAAEQAQLRLSEQNDRLRGIDEFKTQFLATVSHELRAPLSSIVSYAELIRDDEEGLSKDAGGFLDVVQRSAERLTRLVGDLLLLSGIEAGSIPLEPGPVLLRDVVTDAVRAAGPEAAEHGVVLESSVQDGPPLRADRPRLQQVIDNLISNAIKFTGAGGMVRVAATRREGDGDWRVDVADSGIGIPPGERDQLFDRFFRASNARTVGIRGSGLGLSVVKALTEAHGGHVEVVSTPGSGTIFSVYLPAGP